MLPPQELDSLLQDTVPQVMEKQPSSKHEGSTAPSCLVVGGTPADASPAHSPDSTTISSTRSADLDSMAHQASRTDGSSAALRPGEGTAKEDGSASSTEDELRRDGEVDSTEALGSSSQAPEESSFLEELEESYDIGCMPSRLHDEASASDKGSACRSASPSSIEHPESTFDGEASVEPAPAGAETDPSAVLAVADASSEEGDDHVNGPTDEQLLDAIRDIVVGAEDVEQLTPKQVVLLLEARFSCTLQERKKSIRSALMSVFAAHLAGQEDAEEDEQSDHHTASIVASASASSGEDEEEGGPRSSTASLSARESGSDDEQAVLLSQESSGSDGGSAGGSISHGFRKKRIISKGSDDDQAESSAASSSVNNSSEDEDEGSGGGLAARATLPFGGDSKEVETSSGAESSCSEAAAKGGAVSPLPPMPRPQERKTSARRALAKAKMKRAVRGARAGGGKRRVVGSSSAVRGGSGSDDMSSGSESDSDLGSDVRSGAKAKMSRPKPKHKKDSSAEDVLGTREQEDGAEDSRAATSSSSSAESDGSSFEENVSAGPSGQSRHTGKGKGRAGKKQGAVARRKPKAKKAKKDVVNEDGGSALVDSDDEGRGASKGGGPTSTEVAVVQEELDDVNAEKVKERKRIAAERQRQLESLRVMDAVQLKEATRAQQGSLLAKIKERQSCIHAALAASAKEELKNLRAEARKAAGMVGTGEDEEEEEEQGDGLKNEGAGVQPRGEVGKGVDGPEKVEGLEVEDMIAREEEMVAAVAGRNGDSRDGPEEEDAEEEEEEEDSDFAVGGVDDAVAGVGDSRSSLVSGKGAVHSSKQEEGSSESSDSDSDSELEILPAEATTAVQNLMRRQAVIAVSKGAAAAVGTSPRSKHSKNGTASGRKEGAARALAALPKGMRFSSPIAANKNRAANRRKLAASARTVANDRWAAQLGYQDGQEHLRDLKYMELKRRQQAHHERERKEKENAATAARLLEYAAYVDEDEEEFAAGLTTTGTATPAVATADAPPTAAAAGDSGDDPNASGQPTEPAGGAVDESPASISRDSSALSSPEGAYTTTPTAGASAGEPGADTDASTADGRVDAGMGLASGAADHTDMPSPVPETDGEMSAGDAHRPSLLANETSGVMGGAIAPQADSTAVAVVDTPATVTEPSAVPRPAGSAEVAQEEAGVAQTAGSSRSTTAELPAAGGGGTAETAAPTGVVLAPRPKVVRTYGRKARDEGRDVDGRAGSKVGVGGSVSVGAEIGRGGVLSLDSQALWDEGEEEPDWAPPATPGGGGALGAEDESCGFSLGLDNDDDDDDIAVQGPSMDRGSDGVLDRFKDLDRCKRVDGDVCTTEADAEAGTKRKLDKVQAEGGDEDGVAGEPDVVLPLTSPAISSGGGVAPPSAKSGDSAPSFTKMKIAADGGLEAAPVQPGVSDFFKAGAGTDPVSGLSSASSPLAPPPSKKRKKAGIANFFGTTGVDGSTLDTTDGDGERGDGAGETTPTAVACDDTACPSSTAAAAGASFVSSFSAIAAENGPAKTEAESSEEDRAAKEGDKNEEQEAEQEEEDEDDEEEAPGEPKDRSANFRAMLEAERVANRQAKKLRKTGMMDDEAEEEEEEEAVRGLGDFGFGVPAGGTGTAASGDKDGNNGDDEDEVDEEIREEDLEGIVDTFSDDEGDKDAQDTFLNNEAAAGDRQALKDMVRRVREGFGDERGGRGRGSNARGNLRMDELTAADKSSRKEARRLGLLNSDEEWSDDEKGDGKEKDDLEELDEQQLGELLAREQRARHMGLSQTAQEYLDSSDSEGEGEKAGSDGEGREGRVEEEAERLEEARIQKLWVKRAKRRRVLAEVEQSAAGDSQGPELLMQEDEDSQAILSLLQCTNSRLSFSGSVGGGGGDASVDATSSTTSADRTAAASGKRRGRVECSGELDAREVANGFGMGMSSKPLKRAKSDGTEPKDVTTAEARARMDRAFTMPQFVTSVAGYGGSARSKQIQRKGSFLSRSGSLQARSGSLASGKTTVSASKFVFMSSSSSSSSVAPTHDEDTCARTGFEEPAARESSNAGGGGSKSKGGGGWSTSRPPLTASGANVAQRSKAGAFSGIGGGKAGVGGGGAEMGRLWKGLCASGKQKPRR